MKHTYQIELFDNKSIAPSNELALLHEKLLPFGPVTNLGKRFMKKFYYKVLPKAGHIFGAVAYINEHPVGFISATYDSNGFMKSALRQYWWRIIYEVAITMILNPKTILTIWEAVRIMRSRKLRASALLEGEILSIGVLPEYSGYQFIQKSGLHIANDLLDKIMSQFQAKSINLIRTIIDSNNHKAQLFYSGFGWKLNQNEIPGWKTPVLEFVWQKKVE